LRGEDIRCAGGDLERTLDGLVNRSFGARSPPPVCSAGLGDRAIVIFFASNTGAAG